MAATPCPKCGKLRKTEIISTPDGWSEPPCYHCGDPGFLKPYDKEEMGERE